MCRAPYGLRVDPPTTKALKRPLARPRRNRLEETMYTICSLFAICSFLGVRPPSLDGPDITETSVVDGNSGLPPIPAHETAPATWPPDLHKLCKGNGAR